MFFKENLLKKFGFFALLVTILSFSFASQSYADRDNCLNNVEASILWVNNTVGNDATADGTLTNPFETIAAATSALSAQTEICVATSASSYKVSGNVTVNLHGGLDVNVDEQTVAAATANLTSLELTFDVFVRNSAVTHFTIEAPLDYVLALLEGTASFENNTISSNANNTIQLVCGGVCNYTLSNNTFNFRVELAATTPSPATFITTSTSVSEFIVNVTNNTFNLESFDDGSGTLRPFIFIGSEIRHAIPATLNITENSFSFSAEHTDLESFDAIIIKPFNSAAYVETTTISGNTFDLDVSNDADSTILDRLRAIYVESSNGSLNMATYLIEKNLMRLTGTADKVFGFQQLWGVNGSTVINNDIFITGNYEASNGVVYTSEHNQNQRIFNNTIVGTGNLGTFYGIRFSHSQVGSVINNLVYADDTTSSDGTTFGAIFWQRKPVAEATALITALENNLFFDAGSSRIFRSEACNSSTVITDEATLEGCSFATGNIVADPLFSDIDGADFTLQTGSPALDGGQDLSTILTTLNIDIEDILGNARGTSAFDIGAYEHDQVFYQDNDGDGFGDVTTEAVYAANPGEGFVTNSDDCDDTDVEAINVAQDWYIDNDRDGFGDQNASAVSQCVRPANSVLDNTDCDDSDPAKTTDCSVIDPTADDGESDVTPITTTGEDVGVDDGTDTVIDPNTTGADTSTDAADPQIGSGTGFNRGPLSGGGISGCQLNALSTASTQLGWLTMLLPLCVMTVLRVRKS